MDKLLTIQKDLEGLYDLKSVDVTFLRESPDNIVYLIREQGKNIAVLRISKRDIQSDVLFELNWIDALVKKSVPIAPVIPTKEGDLFFETEGTIGVMFKYISGYQLQMTAEKKPDLDRVREGAVALARLHNASGSTKLDLSRKRTIFTELDRAVALESDIIKKLEDGKMFTALVKENIRWAKKQKYKNIFINNDYRPGNLIFNDGSGVTIVDFDWSCMGPAVKDLGLALVEWSFPDVKSVPDQDVIKTFLSAYNEVAVNKFVLNGDLYRWMSFACLSDAATYICDSIREDQPKKAASSYMFLKYLHFTHLTQVE